MTDDIRTRLSRLAADPRFNSAKACDDFLHARGRNWLKGAVEKCVRDICKANKAKRRSALDGLESEDIISNGQKLSIQELLRVLDTTNYPKEWINTNTIEALLMISTAAAKLREKSAPTVQIFGPALGMDFYEEGDIDSNNTNIKTQHIDMLAQLMRLKKEEEPLTPHVDTVRLASLVLAAEQASHIRRKVIVEQARWRELPVTADSWRDLKLEDWHALIVFYGDNTHWRLALVLRHGTPEEVVHIVYDPLYRMLESDDPGHVAKADQVEYFTRIMRGMFNMGYNVLDSWPILIEGATAGDQMDGWSCGWRAFIHFEMLANHFVHNQHVGPAYYEDAYKGVLALAGEHAKTRGERLEQVGRLRDELRDVVTCILALVHHVAQDEIRKESGSRVAPLNRF